MIEKLEKREVPLPGNPMVVKWVGMDNESLFNKLNELVDAVNEFQKILHDVIKESVENMSRVNSLGNTVLELRAKVKGIDNEPIENPTISKMENVDPYAEQRKWIGKLCRFWNFKDGAVDMGILKAVDNLKPTIPYVNDIDYSYAFCEPVKPDDDIIYRGE